MGGTPTTDAALARPNPRLRREERRNHLLDCAAELLVEGGVMAVTMEGVAARAGVSKALPYAHFDNATELVRGLRERELDRLGTRIERAVAAASGFEPRVRAAVHAYFETIRERGAVLVGSLRSLPMDDEEAAARENPGFFVPMLQEHLGLSLPAARVTSAIFVGGVDGAVDVWVSGGAGQAQAEEIYVQLLVRGAGAIAADHAAAG